MVYEKYYFEFWDMNNASGTSDPQQIIIGELNLRGVAAVTDRTVSDDGLSFTSTSDGSTQPYYPFRDLWLKSDYTLYIRFKCKH